MKTHDFELVALSLYRELFRNALCAVRNWCDAEEIVQETYLHAWKSFHRFKLGTNFRAWIFKIQYHVIGRYRYKFRKVILVNGGDDFLKNTMIYQPPVPAHLQDEEMIKSLEAMPQHYRDVVLLADVEEYSYKEIAEALDIPIGTVMSRLSRGRSILRSSIIGL